MSWMLRGLTTLPARTTLLALTIAIAAGALTLFRAEAQPSPCTPGVNCDGEMSISSGGPPPTGDEVDVELSIDYAAVTYYAYQAVIDFDDTALDCVSVSGTGPPPPLCGTTSPVRLGQGTGPTTYVGKVADITFRCLQAGTHALTLRPPAPPEDNTTLFDSGGIPILTSLTGGAVDCGSTLDSDGDGLTDWDEQNTYGTDPLTADTDGDGCSDGGEVSIGFDPLLVWDVFDVPVPALADPTPNGPRNKVVDIGDVLAVLAYAFAGPAPAPPGRVAYDSTKDGDWFGRLWHGTPMMYPDGLVDSSDWVGLRYDRSPGDPPTPMGYDPAGPPNTQIEIGDVLAALAQVYAVDCS